MSIAKHGASVAGKATIQAPQASAGILPETMAGDILDSMSDGVLAVDPQGRILLLNPVAEGLFGLDAAQVTGRTFAEVFVPLPDLDAFNDTMLAAIYNPGQPQSQDLVLTQNGTETHLAVRSNLLASQEDGRPVGVVAVLADISDRVIRLRESVARERGRAVTGRFIVAILTVFSLFTLALEPMQDIAEQTGVDLGAWVGLLAMAVTAVAIQWWTGLPFRDLGITWRLSWAALREAVGVSLAFCGILTAIKLALPYLPMGLTGPDRPLFEAWRMDTGEVVTDPMILATAIAFYLVTLPIQELGSRGAVQAPLHRFLDGVVPAPGWIANGVATLLFAVLHAHLAPAVALMVVVPSLLWGWLFMRAGSVLSPIVSHAIIGVYAVFALGLFNGFDNV